MPKWQSFAGVLIQHPKRKWSEFLIRKRLMKKKQTQEKAQILCEDWKFSNVFLFDILSLIVINYSNNHRRDWCIHFKTFSSPPLSLYYLSCCSLLSVLCSCLRLSSSLTFFVVFFLFFIVTFSSSTLSTTVKTMVQHTGDSPSSLRAAENRYKRERNARVASAEIFPESYWLIYDFGNNMEIFA